ncbi:serine hydrolase domain-containing protein [Dactylosporangium sp. NPDC049140]|uniref:serine hydrolase domain-containing protein n=1 Tax=Dactylosporangium sp. NPDC049140 TaxID=3155647 RepID=UPI0033C4BD5D
MTGVRRRNVMKLAGAAGLATALAPAARASARTADTTWYSSIQGPPTPTMTSFDNTMLGFMEQRGITCGSLAVTDQGRLVKATGYTVNPNWQPVAPDLVQPTTLFRIASISKPITATAINRLAQEGRLNLDTPIGSLVDLTPPTGQTAPDKIGEATVRRVLQHRGGWGDPSVTHFDPMFADRAIATFFGTPLPVTQRQIIKYNSGRALASDPGTTFAYSNYGYLLLGRVIEAVTGMAYAAYVQQAVLGPTGITRMKLGHSLDQAPHYVNTEAVYNTSLEPTPTVLEDSSEERPAYVRWPYGGFNLENMDSHGGWLASAVDLVRFASIFDLPVKPAGVLNQTSVTATFAPPDSANTSDPYYGYGWFVRQATGGVGYNSWHNGSLPGTWTWLVRCFNGRSWAALFNQRDDHLHPESETYADIDQALWNAAAAVTSWPTGDLYPQFFPAA